MRRNDPYGLDRFDEVWRRVLDGRGEHRPPPPVWGHRPPPPPPPGPMIPPPPPRPAPPPPFLPGCRPCTRAVRFHPHERRG